MDAQIAQFTGITGATGEQAQFFLQSANGDLETAMSTFYESGGAQAGTGGAEAMEQDVDDDDDDAEMQAALANTTEGPNDENATATPAAASSSSGGQALGGQTLGGGPAPAASSSSSSGQNTTYKKKSEVRTTQKKTFGSLGTIAREQDDSDDDKPQDFYTGGEKSGLSVEDPNSKKKKKQREDPDGPNDLVKSLLKKAAEGSAARGEDAEGQAKKPKAGSSSWFGGSGNTLGSEETPSESVPDPKSPASQGPGGLASRLGMLPQLRNLFGQNASAPPEVPEEDRPSDWDEPSVTRHLTLWRDGFSVEDGPLMRYDDPKNMQTLKAIQEGAAPTSVLNVRFGQQVELRVAQRTNDEFEAPPPKPMKAFSGSGNRLGSPAPNVTSSSSATPAASTPSAPPTQTPAFSTAFQVDGTKPVTTLQIRLGDGTRQTARFNHDHTIGDIRNWINAGNPGMSGRQYMLMTTFPNKDLDDEKKTIEEAGVKGSVVTQRWL